MEPSRKQLLDSIEPGMIYTEGFFKQMYAYELTWSGFSDIALDKMEMAGYTQARAQYSYFANQYKKKHDEAMARAGRELIEDMKRYEENMRRREVRLCRKKESLQSLSDNELLMRLQKLKMITQK
jgi:hypothetical protein